MVKFHVTRANKVWWGAPGQPAARQPEDAVIEVSEEALPHLVGFGYVEGSSHGQAPLMVETQHSTTPDGPNVKPGTLPKR